MYSAGKEQDRVSYDKKREESRNLSEVRVKVEVRHHLINWQRSSQNNQFKLTTIKTLYEFVYTG